MIDIITQNSNHFSSKQITIHKMRKFFGAIKENGCANP